MKTHRRPRIATRLLAAASITLILVSGCGVRVGQPPAPVPSPEGSEPARQSVAIALDRVLLAAASAPTNAPAGLETTLSTYVNEIGGVWLPPGRDDDPEPTSPALAEDNSDLAAVLREASEVILAQARADEGSIAYASIWLSLHTAAASQREDPAPACSMPCGEQIIPSSLTPVVATGQEGSAAGLLGQMRSQAPQLIGIYDALAYLEEIRAARASTEARDDIADGARTLRQFSEALAGPLSGSENDPRRSAYEIDAGNLEASIDFYARAAATQWLGLLLSVPDPDLDQAIEVVWQAYHITNPDLHLEPWPGFEARD